MISKIKTATLIGLDIFLTEVEVGFSRGLPSVTIVGLPDNAIKESKERIRFSFESSGISFPKKRIVVNLSPADLKKEGSGYDLPIAVGILMGSYKLERNFDDFMFYGELNLKGEIKPVRGVLNFSLFAKKMGIKSIVIPYENRMEAGFIKGLNIYALKNIKEVIDLLLDNGNISPIKITNENYKTKDYEIDFSEIKGQFLAKRVMEIAAAGFHNVLMIGPPGSGKSMISKALPSILPRMTEDEILETSLIYSAAGLLDSDNYLITTRPFRSPHHTISDVGMSGGGRFPKPGEISLSHNGVLFLDELPYFKKSALEVLRQPLEDGKITVSRSLYSYTYPAKFMLICAMNPCEDSIGLKKDEFYECSDYEKKKYYSKISSPLLDRIDLHIEMKKINYEELSSNQRAEDSETIKQRVERAREIQINRFKNLRKKIFANGQMSTKHVKKFCPIDKESDELLKFAVNKFGLSARSYFKILKISRTIADLDQSQDIKSSHIQEALQYRPLNFYEI